METTTACRGEGLGSEITMREASNQPLVMHTESEGLYMVVSQNKGTPI